jgi:hypothetical protein
MRVAHALQRIAGVRLAAVLYRAFGPENQLASGLQDQKSEALIVSMYVRGSSV